MGFLTKPLDELSTILKYRNNRLYLQWYFRHSRRLSRFKDIHRGEDCFIIGNGPSLNKMDLSLLNDYHTFGMNKIYLLFDRVDLVLDYHVAVNDLVIKQSAEEFESLGCPSFLSFGAAQGIVRELEHIYLLATDSYFPAPYSFYRELQQPITEGYTVTYVAMQLAYYMGFQNVFLVGVDHSFKAVGAPNEEQLLSGEDQNHFDPRYFSQKQWHLPDLEASELSYRLAKFFYDRDGRQIHDATVDGKLQIYDKVSYEQALKMCKKKMSRQRSGAPCFR
ncbi:6-hydroxymethylpterin diphosphokinase MptE-like protein [Citrifermentans bremense]|uniref:6-hydroxymethylpterin diphosphokinase MptE-like protein n=1 Tax=Citrifermentans bremense TaxID=60035 RepID=UPI0003FF190D|nr:6-hydroxymethylpterin diphosphokinase MptE-like protein [Citrifermentans bremense]